MPIWRPSRAKLISPKQLFIFPREAAIESQHGVQVRIFTPREEAPVRQATPTLGTAMELRSSRMQGADKVSLDLKAGKISVTFHNEADGSRFLARCAKRTRSLAIPIPAMPWRPPGRPESVDDIADDVPVYKRFQRALSS